MKRLTIELYSYYEAHVDQVRKIVRKVAAGDTTTGRELHRLSPALLKILEMNEAENKMEEKERRREEQQEKIDKMLDTIEQLKALLPQVQQATHNAQTSQS